jgi:hypothetical protein
VARIPVKKIKAAALARGDVSGLRMRAAAALVVGGFFLSSGTQWQIGSLK